MFEFKKYCARLTASLLLVGASFLASAVEIDEDYPASLREISHEVVFVDVFGYWKQGRKKGIYRLVLVNAEAKKPHSKIFLQWVQSNTKSGEHEVIAISPIKEINRIGVYRLLSSPVFSAVENEKTTQVEMTIVNQYSLEVQSLHILPTKIGEYKITFVDEPSANITAISETLSQALNSMPLNLDYYFRPTF